MKKILVLCIVLAFSGIATMAIAAKPAKMDLWHCGCWLEGFVLATGQASTVSLKYSNLDVRGMGRGHGSESGANGHDDPETCSFISNGDNGLEQGATYDAVFDRWDIDYEATSLSEFVMDCSSSTNPDCPIVGEVCGQFFGYD
jgi:hypothetical protein